jgi:hypothetical protein
MIKTYQRKTAQAFTGLLATALIISFSGCIGAMTQLAYVIKGYDTPAAYDGLEGKRVAVVCVSDASAYGPDPLTYTVAKALGIKLAQGVKKIEVVPHAEIENWIDQNGWDEASFSTLGAGVKADRVIAIEIGGYSIHEGSTIFKGQCELTVSVYDLEGEKGAKVAYGFGPEEYAFPKNGRPSIQSSDRQFEAFYLSRLTQRIANHFVKHDHLDSYAEDAMDF